MTFRAGSAFVIAALLAFTGCSSGSDVPPPKPPTTPVLDTRPEPPPNRAIMSGLDITSSPSMEVKVNGKDVGTTPTTVDNLPEGTYEVTFVDPKHGDTTMVVELGEGEFKRVHHSVSPDASDARVGD